MIDFDADNTITLPTVIYEQLQAAILNGVFKPGQVLRQEDIAAHLGVSRSPLREALSRLEADGIVTSRPHRGYAVVELESRQIEEAFDLRSLLEAELARRAIRTRTEAHVAEVYHIAHEMSVAPDVTDLDSLSHWHNLHTSFHLALLEPSDCPQHLRAWRHSYNLVELYTRTESRLTGNVQKPQAEHVQLAQAFALGNEERFVTLTLHHSRHTRERLMSKLTAPATLAGEALE
ncbi:GntR family transcriptional regulator [Pusillimonas sp.]|uniref:GntR family transcriptional regulator n=1 Tax=Pusillimonas sp. TaxID=3040095 RepID=UPI0037CA8DDC